MIFLKLYYQKFLKRMTIRKSGIPLNVWKTLPNNSAFLLNKEKAVVEKYHYFNLPKLNINDENFWENYILLFKRVQFMASSNYEYNQLYLIYLADKIVEFSYDSKNIDFEIIALIELFLGRDYSDTEFEFNKRYNKEIPKRIKRPESIIEFYETCINLKKKYDLELSKNFYSYDNIVHFLLEYYKNSSFNSPRFYFLFFSIKSNLAFFECFKFNNIFYKKFFDFSCETLYDYNILCNFYEKKIQNLGQKDFLQSMYTNISSFFFELFSFRKSNLISFKNISFKNVSVFLYPTYIKQVLPYYISSLKNFNIFNVRLNFKHQAWKLPVFFYRISGLFEFLEKKKEKFLFSATFYNILFYYNRIKNFFMSFYEQVIVDGLSFTGTRMRLFIFRANKSFNESLRNKKYGVVLFFWKKYHKNDFKNFEPFNWAYIVYFTYNMEKLYGVLGFDSLLHVNFPESVKFHVNKLLKLTKKSNYNNLTKRLKNLYYYRYTIEFKYIKLFQKISTLGYVRSFLSLFFFNLYFKFNFYLIYFLIKRAFLTLSFFFLNLKLKIIKYLFNLKSVGKYQIKNIKNIKNSFIYFSFLDNSLFTKDMIRFFYLNEITFFYNTLKLNNNLFKNIHRLSYKYLFKNIYLILKLFINYSKFNLFIFLNKLSFDLVTLFNLIINEFIWFKSFLISLPSFYYKIIAFDTSKYFLKVAEKVKIEFNFYNYIKLNIFLFFEKIIKFFHMAFEKLIILIKKTYQNFIKIIKWFFTFLKNIIKFNFNFITTIIKTIKPFFFIIRDYIVSFSFTQLVTLKVFLRRHNSLSFFKAIKFYVWELLFALFRIAFFFIPLFYLIFYVNDFISYLQEFEYLDYLSTCTVYSLLWTFLYIYFFIFLFPILTFIRNIPKPTYDYYTDLYKDKDKKEEYFREMTSGNTPNRYNVWVIDVTSKEWPKVQEKIKKYPELSKYIKTNINDLDGMSDLRFNGFVHSTEQLGEYFHIYYTVEDFNEVLEHFDEILRNYSGLELEYENPEKWTTTYSEFELSSGSIIPNFVPIKGYEEVYKKSLYYYNEALKLKLTTPDADPTVCRVKLNTYYRRTLVKNELMSKLTLISENDWHYPGFCKLLSEAFLLKYAIVEEEYVIYPVDHLFDEDKVHTVPVYHKLPCFLPHCKHNKILNEDDDVSSFKNMLPMPKSLIMDTNILMSVVPGISPKFYEKKKQELIDKQTREHKRINLELGEDLSLEEAMAWKTATSKNSEWEVRFEFWGAMVYNLINIGALFCVSLWLCISPDGEQMIDPFFNVWDGAQYSIEYWFSAQDSFDFHKAITDPNFVSSFLVEHKQTSLIFDKNHKPMYKSTVTYSRMTEEEFKNYKVDRKTVEFKRNVRQREQT